MAALCIACGRGDPEATFRRSLQAYRQGDHEAAQHSIRQGLEESRDARWQRRFHTLECRILLTDGKQDAASAIVAELEKDSPPGPWLSYLKGRLAQDQHSDLAAAGRYFQTAVDGARSPRDPELLTESLSKLAGVLARQRQPDKALSILREAVRESSSADDFDRGVAALNLGLVLYRDRGEHDAAIESLERAVLFSRSAGARLLESAARNNLGAVYRMVGEFDRALRTLHEALAIQHAARSARLTVGTLDLIGLIHAQRGEFARALDYLDRSSQVARSLDQPLLVRDTTVNLTEALIETGQFERAASVHRELEKLFERFPQLPGREYLELNRASLALARRDPAAAIPLYGGLVKPAAYPAPVRWEAQAGLARAYELAGDTAKARAHYQAALDVVERAQSRHGEESRLSFLTQVMRSYRSYAALLVREGDESAALDVEDSSRARSLVSQMDAESGGTVRGANLAARLQRITPRGVAYLTYWIGPEGSYARVISRNSHERIELPVRLEDLERLVRSWRTFLDRDRGDPLSGDEPAGVALYQALLAPLGDRIPPGARVIIVPDAPLHGLNFETLPVPGARRLWIADATISIAPSLALMVTSEPTRTGARSLLLIGDPVAGGAEFPRLGAASIEMAAVQKQFKKALVKQDVEATPYAFESADPVRFSHIHFAAHAKANRESPLDSFVMLSPREGRARLYARDIARSRLSADLVTLSACRSAGDRAYSGEGLVGLSWAFLRAGANHVIAGLWDVPDKPTSELMTLLYEQLAAGLPPAEALRNAKLRFLERAEGADRKPYSWAAFQVYERIAPRQ